MHAFANNITLKKKSCVMLDRKKEKGIEIGDRVLEIFANIVKKSLDKIVILQNDPASPLPWISVATSWVSARTVTANARQVGGN